LDGPQPVIVMEYCAGGIKSNQITFQFFIWLCEENLSLICTLKYWLIRKFGQVVVWFKCESEWRTQNSIDSRNCSRNVSSSQTQYCSSWSCCKKHFTHIKWRTQNLCTFSLCVFLLFYWFISISHILYYSHFIEHVK
jgi:hypothetical protein